MLHLEARRGRYQPSISCVLSPLSQNLSVAVSLLGTTELMFIEPGVKINGAYYRDVLLGQHLLPVIRSVAGDFFTYNAPAHRDGDTVEFLSRHTPDIISPLLWPPNSPDLNPVHYKVCGVLLQRVYRSRIRDASTTWNSVSSRSGVASTRTSLTEQFDNGVFDYARAFPCKRQPLWAQTVTDVFVYQLLMWLFNIGNFCFWVPFLPRCM